MKQGNIYKLGNHILGCGSSTDKEFVDKVISMGVKEIRCVLTDTPYGIAYVEGTQGIESKQRKITEKIKSDQLQTDEGDLNSLQVAGVTNSLSIRMGGSNPPPSFAR